MGSISHTETATYNSVLCELFFTFYICKFCANKFLHVTGVYDLLYSAVHPLKYLESDVMWYNNE